MGFIKRLLGQKEEISLPNPVKADIQSRDEMYQQILRENAARNAALSKPTVMQRVGRAIVKAATSNTIVNPHVAGQYVHKQFRQRLGRRNKLELVKINKDGSKVYRTVDSRYPRAISPERAQAIARFAGVRIPSKSKVNRGVNQGKKGRPIGTFDQRYARFGGVYGYRKWLSEQRALRRLQQQSQGTPQYQQEQYQPQQMNVPQPMNVPEPFPRPYPKRPTPPPQNPIMQTYGESMNVLKIKMNDLRGQPQNKMNSVFNPEVPMGDSRGDYYTVPDFFSGRQILKRRTHDNLFKW